MITLPVWLLCLLLITATVVGGICSLGGFLWALHKIYGPTMPEDPVRRLFSTQDRES
jgi:hypothetical protein